MRCALARFSVVSFFALTARVWMSLTRSAPSCALSAMFLIARLISSDMVFISVADALIPPCSSQSLCRCGNAFHLAVDLIHVFPDGGDMAAQGLCIVLHAPKVSRKALPILWKAAARFPMLSFLSKYFCSTSCVKSPCASVSE